MSSQETVKRPNVGDLVITKFGDAKVTEVERDGLVLKVQTIAHGTETIERAAAGWWTVRREI